ncbi:MAG: DNA-binding protein [Bacteroidaceae bacterium]|nr:DNA-binding protein [Bacteroidaceae bacterium]
MIDYSVAGRPSNPGDKNSEKKYYAQIQQRGLVETPELVEHVHEHNTAFTEGTIKGVLTDAFHCVREYLLESKKVYVEGVGWFFLSLQSRGTATAAEFTASCITGMSIMFTPDPVFDSLMRKAKFNPVSSRVAQAATLKAEKEGADTVNLAEAKAKARGTSSTGNSPEEESGSTDTGDTGGSSEGTGNSSEDNGGDSGIG